MVYFGGGGFSFTELYNMPVAIRNLIYKRIVENKKKETEQAKGISQSSRPKLPFKKPK